MQINRRSTLFGIGAAMSGGVTAKFSAALANPEDGRDGADLHNLVEQYVAFGSHRTGSLGEIRTANWIRERLDLHGFTTALDPFPVTSHRQGTASLLVGSDQISGLIAQPPFRSAQLSAPLAVWYPGIAREELAGRIVVFDAPFARHSSLASGLFSEVIDRCDGVAAGLIIHTTGPTGDPVLLNVEREVRSLPLAVCGAQASAAISTKAHKEGAATLQINGRNEHHITHNVIGHRAGSGPRLMVTTPFSGWGLCAGERGPGVAIFLKLAAVLADASDDALLRDFDLTFVATTGHELDHAGGKRLLQNTALAPVETDLWVHLGAGLAARDWHDANNGYFLPLPSADPQRYLGATADLVGQAQSAFAGLSGLEQVYEMNAQEAAGELRDILAAGYSSVLGGFGAHRFHHAEKDDMRCIEPRSLALAYQAFLGAIVGAMRARG